MRPVLLLGLLVACHGKGHDGDGDPDGEIVGDTGDSGGSVDDTGATDADGDGWTVADGDCDDDDAAINPGATDLPCTGVAEDCVGTDGDLFVPRDHARLQYAVDAAPDGAWICVEEGTWSPVVIDHPVSLAALPGEVVISGGGSTTPVVVMSADDVLVRGFQITDGLWGGSTRGGSLSAGGMQVQDSVGVQIIDNTFSYNQGYAGGGLFVMGGGDTTIQGNSFDDNAAHVGGGLVLHDTGDATVQDNWITENTCSDGTAGNQGGGLAMVGVGDVSVSGNFFEHNLADEEGGAVLVTDGGDVVFSDNEFGQNRALQEGGALYAETPWLTMDHNAWVDNASDTYGGAFFVRVSGTAGFTGDEFTGNGAYDMAVGMFAGTAKGASLTLDDVVLDNNVGRTTGAVGMLVAADADTVAVDSLDAMNNLGGAALGLVGVAGATVSRADFTDNDATDSSGGGLLAWMVDSLIVQDGLFEGNQADQGAGLYALEVAVLQVDDSVFTDNSVTGQGGALSLAMGCSAVVLDGVSVTDNHAVGGGGGIYSEATMLTLEDSDVSGNTTDAQGGGIDVQGGTASASLVLVDTSQVHDNSPDQVSCQNATTCIAF